MSKKYYAVRAGRKPGIYRTWAEAKDQVHGFPNAIYRSFTSAKEAEAFLNNGQTTPTASTAAKNSKTSPAAIHNEQEAGTLIAYVDGSFDKATNRYSFGVVLLENNQVIETLTRVGDNPKYQGSWQIAGEVFGALHAIHWAIKNNFQKIILHYDYVGIEHWARGEWKTNKAVSQDYVATFKKLEPFIDIHFVKVKAHSGIEYNEMADQLAKDALKNAPLN